MNKKAARKKLKEKAKFAKRFGGRKEPLPPNKVVPDKKKKENKKAARMKDKELSIYLDRKQELS